MSKHGDGYKEKRGGLRNPEGMAALERVNAEGQADPLAATKHGAYLRSFFPCSKDKCPVWETCERAGEQERCAIEHEIMGERTEFLRGLEHIDPAIHGPAIRRYAWQILLIERIMRWASVVPPVRMTDRGWDIEPVLKSLQPIMNAAGRMEQELGLTPAELRKLREKPDPGGGFLAIMREAEAIEARQREAAEGASDAEFEHADEEEGDGGEAEAQ